MMINAPIFLILFKTTKNSVRNKSNRMTLLNKRSHFILSIYIFKFKPLMTSTQRPLMK